MQLRSYSLVDKGFGKTLTLSEGSSCVVISFRIQRQRVAKPGCVVATTQTFDRYRHGLSVRSNIEAVDIPSLLA
jgi:hypothetical protein